jgi:hypothetical protein
VIVAIFLEVTHFAGSANFVSHFWQDFMFEMGDFGLEPGIRRFR